MGNDRKDVMKVEDDAFVAVVDVDDAAARDDKEVDEEEADDEKAADIELDSGEDEIEVSVDVSVGDAVVDNGDDDVEAEGGNTTVCADENDVIGATCIHSVPEHMAFVSALNECPSSDSDAVEGPGGIEVDISNAEEIGPTLEVEEVCPQFSPLQADWVVATTDDLLVNGHQVVYTVFNPLIVVVAVDNVY